MKLFLTTFLLICSHFLFSQDFRNVNWNDSKDSVKLKEKAILIDENAKSNYVEEVHFVDFEGDFAYHIYYVFRKDHLIGVKTQRIRLTGDNTKFNALEDYKAEKLKMIEKWGEEKIMEKGGFEQAIKIMEVSAEGKEVFVTIEKSDNEYFLVQNIFLKGH